MKIVLAYSGGLDTSVILKWLQTTYDAEVIAFCADLGQGEELDTIPEKAEKTGATECHILDLVEEFAGDYVYPMMQAGAIYENQYFLGTAIARPLIAKAQIDIARKTHADAVSHGATGKGNDQVRFELTFTALAPDLHIIAPWREWDFKGRTDLVNFAREHGIKVPVSPRKIFSMDRNLLHCSFEAGPLEDPWYEPPKDMFVLSVDPEDAPDTPEYIEVEFEQGRAVALKTGDDRDARTLSPAEMIKALNTVGGRHGVGRVDMVENRFVGMKSRGVYETPGGAILFKAHRQIESITMERDLMHLRDSLIPRYSDLVYNGFWFSPEREALQALVNETQRFVTGTVRLKLYKGNIIAVGRKSQFSLYDERLATMEADRGAFNQPDAGGFIRLNGLRLHARFKAQKGPQLSRPIA